MPLKSIKQYLVRTANKFTHLNVLTSLKNRLKTFSLSKKHSKTVLKTVYRTTLKENNLFFTTEVKFSIN